MRWRWSSTDWPRRCCATARTSDEVGATLLDQTCTLLAAPTAALVLRAAPYGDAVIRLAHGAWAVRRGIWPWLIEDIYSIVGVQQRHDQQIIGVLMLGHHAEFTSNALHLLAVSAQLAASAFAALPWADTADSSA